MRVKKILVSAGTAAVVLLTAFLAFFYLSYRSDRRYNAAIEKFCAAFGAERSLIYAVIKTESGFREKAVSRAGAVGLMQIMPETGRWLASKLNKTDFTEDKLSDGGYNIELGVWYIAYLIKKFGARDAALIAYNAGPANAERWLREGKIKEVPFKETRDYVKKVNGHYKYYKLFL